MEFVDKVSEEEFQEILNLDSTIPPIPENWACYWVKVSEEDFLHRIHRVIQDPSVDLGVWEKFSLDSCLGCFSQQVYESRYRIQDDLMKKYPQLQKDNFDKIKDIVENFCLQKMLYSPLCYLANKKTGPYVIRESIRRHIAAYIHYFILKKEKFEPIVDKKAICMIPDDERYYNYEIPNKFC